MKRLYTVLFAALLGMLTTGCIETHMLITVEKDGSGTVQERVVMNNMVVGMMQGMAKSMGGEDAETGTSDELFSREDVLEQAAEMGEGVELVSFEEIEEAGGTGYVAVFSFDDINTLRVKQDPGESMPTMPGEAEEEEPMEEDESEHIFFAFEPGSPARLTITPPEMEEQEDEEEIELEVEEEEGDAENQVQLGGFEQMAQFMRGMHISMVVHVRGSIVETNAQYAEDSKITIMDIDFDKVIDNPEKLKELEAAEEKGPAATMDILRDIPGMKLDLSEDIFVTFN